MLVKGALALALVVLVGLAAGAMIIGELRGPPRSVIAPIEITPDDASKEVKEEPKDDRSQRERGERRSSPARAPAPTVQPPPPPPPAPSGAQPAPAPAVPAGDDGGRKPDDGGDEDDEGTDDDGDDDHEDGGDD